MNKRVVDLSLAVAAMVGALWLSAPYWVYRQSWLALPRWRTASFIVGLALVVFVLYALGTALWALAGRGRSSRSAAVAARMRTHPWVLLGATCVAFSLVLSGAIEVGNYRILGAAWFGRGMGPLVVPREAALLLFVPLMVMGAALIGFNLRVTERVIPWQQNRAGPSRTPATALRSNYPGTGWSRYLLDDELEGTARPRASATRPVRPRGREVTWWLVAVWLVSGIVAASMIGSSMSGAATVPSHVLRAIGYTGAFLVTVLFASRLMLSRPS